MPDAGRVIAGRAKGVRLLAPGPVTRPLADRLKQALFAVLEPRLEGARFLDLYAGSGAAGIEALSRGAAVAVFVERDPGAAAVLGRNLSRAGLGGPSARLVRAEAGSWLAAGAGDLGPFDVVFVDPPYAATAELEAVLELLGRPSGPVVEGGIVVAKHFWRDRPPAIVGLLASERERRFGESALTFYRRSGIEGGEA